MQQTLVATVLIIWLTITGIMSKVSTDRADTGWFILLWLILFFIPFLMRPLGWLQRQFSKHPYLLSHRKGRIFIHISPWQPTIGLPRERVSWFWAGLFEATNRGLQKNSTVIVASHLLTSCRAQRLRFHLSENLYQSRSRIICVPFTAEARAVMQLEILFRQWQWRRPSRTIWRVLVIRSKTSVTRR